MKKLRLRAVMMLEIILICLLSILMIFQSICIHTLSDNYLNIVVSNQIIDYVIENYTDITNDQLVSLQNDLINSDELYELNKSAFDLAIESLKDDQPFTINESIHENFSVLCIDMMEVHLDRILTDEQKDDIYVLMENDTMWSRFLQNFYNIIAGNTLFIVLYSLSGSFALKIILGILILIGLLIILKRSKRDIWLNLSVVSIVSSLFMYLTLFVVEMLEPVLAKVLNLENLGIETQPILYIAMFLLSLGLGFIYFVVKSYQK